MRARPAPGCESLARNQTTRAITAPTLCHYGDVFRADTEFGLQVAQFVEVLNGRRHGCPWALFPSGPPWARASQAKNETSGKSSSSTT
jgi:hypothetical protein